ncbi:uncharacterized protein LOC142159863 isoform X2 [Mixophyes fleayi]|uniref:uncharacterized protein LOC142159863 isoform X2 n=1 Tax=Mixophyes fleayi TaxID=3061075 RepID=UPI003F4E1655
MSAGVTRPVRPPPYPVLHVMLCILCVEAAGTTLPIILCGWSCDQLGFGVARSLLDQSPSSVLRMDKGRNEMILNLTLEIIYLLTGENYTVVKKTSGERETPSSCVSEGLSRTQSPITVPPPHSLMHERNNDQRILELTNKIIQLLTGEVPIRCEDVTVYFSMEEWEYLEGHKDLYKDVMMENHQTLTSLDGSSNRNTPERCLHHLYSHNCTEGEDLTVIEGEINTDVRDDQQCKEEGIPTAIGTNMHSIRNTLEVHLHSSPGCEIEDNVTQDSPGENPSTPNIPQVLHSADLSSDPSSYEQCFIDKLDISTLSKAHKGEKVFLCPKCGKCFTQKSHFVIHKRIHRNEKPFPCSECGKKFKWKSELNKHKIYHGKKPFSCSECGRFFTLKPDLVKHQRTHTGEKPFTCSECGISCTLKSNLTIHQRIHTGEKPFSCSECGKCFTHKSAHDRHQRKHTGEKPFTCSRCLKCFSLKSNLITHQRIHTGEKPFTCSECGKCFSQSSSLVTHQKLHTGEKPFPCSECGKCFATKGYLVQHLRTHTRGKQNFVSQQKSKKQQQKYS